MDWSNVLISLVVVLHEILASSEFLPNRHIDLLSEMKADLARSYLEKESEKIGDDDRVSNVSHTRLAELNVSNSGENIRIFRSADNNFFFTGSDLLRLEKKDSQKSHYVLNAVQDVRLQEGAVFFKNAEWKDKMFLVVCYQQGYCEIRVSAKALESNLKQRIDTKALPLDVIFFETDAEFFMIAVLDPVMIYRWTGTYFNEDYHLDTVGAQSVAVIKDGDKYVIVVAQNLKKNKVYSKVFVRKNDHVELLQLLRTHRALRVLPYRLIHGEDVLNYIFVLNSVHSSSVFFWTGKEFLLWKNLSNVYGQRIVYVGEIESNVFFFISDQNKLYVYHPTPTEFLLMQIIVFDQNIVGIDLRQEKHQYPILVTLTGSPMDPYYKVSLLLLKVVLNYSGKSSRKSSNGVWRCMADLKGELDSRRQKLDEIFDLVIRDGHSKQNFTAENFLNENPDEAMVRLAETVEDLESRMRSFRDEENKGFERGQSKKYHVRGDLTIDRMEADAISVQILNGEKPRFENILSSAKDQTFSVKIEANTLKADVLQTPSLNGILVKDMLLRKKNLQSVSGDFTLNSLQADDIKFGPSARINQVPASDVVLNDSASRKPIRGHKTFSKLKAGRVQAKTINGIPPNEWLSKILPSFKKASEEEEPLNFTSLSVKKLWVSNLNGVPWNEFDRSNHLFADFNNNTVEENLTVEGTARIKNLKTKKINGIHLRGENDSMRKSKDSKSCPFVFDSKFPKSLALDLNRDWDDSFLKEILNESESKYENEIRFFPEKEKIAGDVEVSRVFVKNPAILSDSEVNLATITDRFWIKDEDQVIDVSVNFPQSCFVENLTDVETINGIPLDSFARTDRPNEISGRISFRNFVRIIGNVSLAKDARQNVDLNKLNETSAKTIGENTLKASKRFTGNLKANRVKVNALNGAIVKDLGNLLKGDIERSDRLNVSQVVIKGNLKAKNGAKINVLNGREFNETVTGILTWNDADALGKARFGSLNVQNLQVNKINDLRIEDKLPGFFKTHEREDLSVIIEGNLKVGSIQAKAVNGMDFDKFMNQIYLRNESETIRGEKTFNGSVTVRGNLQGVLNTYNVTELDETALSKSKPQEITGTYTVEEFKANDVEADYLDGVPTDELLFQDETSEQVINADVVFNDLAVAGNVKASDFMSGCDLTKVKKIDLANVNDFENLFVRGPISWETPHNEPGGLNYFLTNVVSKNRNQSISGNVTFENDVSFNNIQGSRYINNVNLSFIARDAVLKSQKDQEILAPLTFKRPVRAKSVIIQNEVLVDTINDLDITDIGQRLVRKSSDAIVTGRKIFRNGFKANHFNAETINGKKTNQIIFYDEVKENKELFLPPATFKNLNIFNDLTVSRVNGYRLSKIIEERLLKEEDNLSKESNVNGSVIVEGDVLIKGFAKINEINDIKMDDVVLLTEESSGTLITGDVEFSNDVLIAGDIQVDYLNGENITALREKALMVDDDAVIEGNLEFLDDISVEGNVNVSDTLNNCDLNEIADMDFPRVTNRDHQKFREVLRHKINLLSNLTATSNKPLVFMYLDEEYKLDLRLPSMHSTTLNQYKDFVEFNVYGMKRMDCGLPLDCYCPTQTNVFVQSMDPPSIRIEPNSTRFFKHFDKELQVDVTVTTTTVSYSSRCRKGDEELDGEHTSISWRTFENDETIFELNVETGFLSDVKFFRLGDSIYAVMAFYFHPKRNETNNLHTVVYEIRVNNKTLEKVDEIPSSGVQVLEIFWTMKGVVLVVGNSFDSERYTDSVNSGIYRFNEYKNKFELLRFVKTHGILAIKSMRYKKTSFIFFVQKQSWPLLILKYNQEYDNYYFSQKLDTARSIIRSNFLSVSVISTGSEGYSGDVFIGIVLTDDSFRLFKYKHIEGFVEESYQEQNNVRILHPFWMKGSQFILAGSSMDSSKIYKIIEQGR